MTAYALGLSFVMLIMAAATTIALMLLRIDYYYILGPIAGLAILLPYVGVIFSTVPAVAVAYFQYDGRKALIVLAVYTLLQFLEGNVLTPLIVGGRVRLFPLTVMVVFIFWGLLWGVPGAILAVPLTSALKVVCENVTAGKDSRASSASRIRRRKRCEEQVQSRIQDSGIRFSSAYRATAGSPRIRPRGRRGAAPAPSERRGSAPRGPRAPGCGSRASQETASAVRREEEPERQDSSSEPLRRRVEPEGRPDGALRSRPSAA